MHKVALLLFIILVSGCLQTTDTIIEENENISSNVVEPDVEVHEEPELSLEQRYWKQRLEAALEQVECPEPRDPETLPVGYYRGPMIDAHIHMSHLPDGGPGSELEVSEHPLLGVNIRIPDWVCMMDVEGTHKSLAFFSVWEPITQQSLDLVKRTMDEYPDRFIPFIMPPDDDGSPDGYPTVDAPTLEEMLSVYPGLFEGYGEIGLYAREGGAPELPPNSQRLEEIYPVVREHKLVVYLHLGEGHKEELEEAAAANPDITFIFHGDQLIDCAECDRTPDAVAEILENHPNVYYGVDELYGNVFIMNEETTKKEFIAHFADYEPLLEEDLKNWKDFIEDHPDRVLWGTDRGWNAPWSLDPEVALVLNNYTRAFIGRLDPAVQEKYAYKNAERIFGR